jgi:hypothetical protein
MKAANKKHETILCKTLSVNQVQPSGAQNSVSINALCNMHFCNMRCSHFKTVLLCRPHHKMSAKILVLQQHILLSTKNETVSTLCLTLCNLSILSTTPSWLQNSTHTLSCGVSTKKTTHKQDSDFPTTILTFQLKAVTGSDNLQSTANCCEAALKELI